MVGTRKTRRGRENAGSTRSWFGGSEVGKCILLQMYSTSRLGGGAQLSNVRYQMSDVIGMRHVREIRGCHPKALSQPGRDLQNRFKYL